MPTEDGSDTVGSPIFTLQSPVAGTVIERRALRGQMLDPGTAAFRIADLSTLWLTVHAFERDAVRIQRGTPAQVTLLGACRGRPSPGNVTLVARQVSTESRTIDVRIERAQSTGAAAARHGGDRPRCPSAPAARRSWRFPSPRCSGWATAGASSCRREAGVFETRKIGRGRDLGGEVEVLSGLAAGETIVVDGAFLLKSQAEKRRRRSRRPLRPP